MIERINIGINNIEADVECVEVLKDQWISQMGQSDLLRLSETQIIEIGSISRRFIRELELIELVGESGRYDVTVIVRADFIESEEERPGQPLGWLYGTPDRLGLEEIADGLKAGFSH